MQEAAEESAA